jgi:hypothetical protein
MDKVRDDSSSRRLDAQIEQLARQFAGRPVAVFG